jgi:hypothetical protein
MEKMKNSFLCEFLNTVIKADKNNVYCLFVCNNDTDNNVKRELSDKPSN